MNRRTLRPLALCASVLSVMPFFQRSTLATNGTWNVNNSGLWSATADWLSGVVATGIGATADFSTVNITADRSVHLDTNRTVGTLTFGDATPSNNWLVDNNSNAFNVLTLGVSSGVPVIRVTNDSVTLNLNVNGNQGFSKEGAGTLVLGSFTNVGPVTINQGMLTFGAGGALDLSTALAVNTGGTLNLNGHAQAFSALSGTSFITNLAAAPATLTLNNTASISTAVVVTGNTSFVFSGGGTLTPTPGVKWTYTGDTSLTQGTLICTTDDFLPHTTSLFIGATSTFDISKSSQTVAGLSGSGTLTNNANGGLIRSFTVNTSANSSTSVHVTGALQFIKDGPATLTLSSPVTNTSGILIRNGTLQVGAINFLPVDSILAIDDTGTLDLNQHTVQLSFLTGSGTVTNASNAGFAEVVLNIDSSYVSDIHFASSVVLSKSGSATLTLTAPLGNSTIINQGVIQAGVTNLFPQNQNLSFGAGSFDINGFDQSGPSDTIGGVITNSSPTLATYQYRLNSNIETSTLFSGNLGLDVFSASPFGNGTLILNSPASYTGPTSISQGALKLFVSDTLPTTTKLFMSPGTTFDLAGHNQQLGGLSGDGSVIVSTGFSTLTISNAIDDFTSTSLTSARLALTKLSTGALILAAPANYSGLTSIAAGTLPFNAVGNSVAAVSGAGALDINYGASLTTNTISVDNLIIAGTLTLRPGANATKVNKFAINTTFNNLAGHLELNDNGVIIQNGSAQRGSAISQLNKEILSGFSNPTANVETITSSVAAADPRLTVGVFDNAALNRTTWRGQAVDATSLLITPALKGDANLDGVVNFNDMLVVTGNWNLTGLQNGNSTIDFAHGDLNSDGVVNFNDMLVVTGNWNNTSNAFNLATLIDDPASATQLFGDPSLNGTAAPVPEPFSAILLALGSTTFLQRRRIRRR